MPGSDSGGALGSRVATLATVVSRSRAVTSLGAALVAAASVALAAGGAAGGIVAAGWSLSAAALAIETVAALTMHRAGDAATPAAGPGGNVAARVLLIVTAGIGAERHDPGQNAGIWLGVGIVALTVLAEPTVARAQPRAEVAGLPGFRGAPGSDLVNWMAPASIAVLVVAGLAGIVNTAALARVVLPLVALVVFAGEAAVGLLNARDRGPRRIRLRRALEAYAPRFAVYTARDDGGVYQVAMWLPYLEQLNVPYLVVTRRAGAVQALAGLTTAPVIARDSWRDLDDVVVPTLRAAFYVNSVSANTNFVSYRQMTHVYLGHGDSDKPLSHHPQHAMFDRVFVAGPAAIERYARNGVAMRAEAFVVVGRPQLSALSRAVEPASYPRRVLYAPTWAGYNKDSSHSSLARGVEIVQALLDRGAVVVFRPHPFTRDRAAERKRAAAVDAVLRDDAARTGRAHRWGPQVDDASFAECANDSDAMIADISSVVVDYLATDKPLAVTAGGSANSSDAAQFDERYPVTRGTYFIGSEPGELSRNLDGLLGDDPGRARREVVRDFYLGGLDGPQALAAFVTAARAAIADSR